MRCCSCVVYCFSVIPVLCVVSLTVPSVGQFSDFVAREFLRFPGDKICPWLLATDLAIFRMSAGDLCFPKLLNYFCSVIGLPSLICGQFIYWRLVDS